MISSLGVAGLKRLELRWDEGTLFELEKIFGPTLVSAGIMD